MEPPRRLGAGANPPAGCRRFGPTGRAAHAQQRRRGGHATHHRALEVACSIAPATSSRAGDRPSHRADRPLTCGGLRRPPHGDGVETVARRVVGRRGLGNRRWHGSRLRIAFQVVDLRDISASPGRRRQRVSCATLEPLPIAQTLDQGGAPTAAGDVSGDCGMTSARSKTSRSVPGSGTRRT